MVGEVERTTCPGDAGSARQAGQLGRVLDTGHPGHPEGWWDVLPGSQGSSGVLAQ